LVGGDRVALDDEASGWSGGLAMSMGLVMKSAMLSGKITSLVEAIELHEEP
jgi:hypothetical protein